MKPDKKQPPTNKLIVKTKPTLRDKKRYVVYKIISEVEINQYDIKTEIEQTYKNLFGSIDFVEANLRFHQKFSTNNKGLMQVSRAQLEKLKVVLGWIKKVGDKDVLIHCILVSGTIKTCKEFLNNCLFPKNKMLLTSAGFENPKVGKEFLKLVCKSAPEIKIIFIPTASRTTEELVYVKESKEELLKLGIKNQNIKELNLDHEISYKEVEEFDVIYVCGGNTFYLLNQVRETGFDKIITQFLDERKVYVGVSAGSIITGPNIENISLYGSENDVKLKDLTGLKLQNTAIYPHFDEGARKEVEKFRKTVKYKVVGLTDNQALLILNNTVKLIE